MNTISLTSDFISILPDSQRFGISEKGRFCIWQELGGLFPLCVCVFLLSFNNFIRYDFFPSQVNITWKA